MNVRGIVIGVLSCLALSACSASTGSPDGAGPEAPFTLPVGPTQWDTAVPTWFYDGTLHVGEQTVELGDSVDEYVLGATGVYWMQAHLLMFTSAEGETQEVHDVRYSNLAVSADHTVLATVDGSRGPTDRYGAHVMQVAAFDTRTGEQLYRTPDEEPPDGDDLEALYSELMPLLQGVSDERIFFDDLTIRLDDGSTTRTGQDAEGMEVFPGQAETLFTDGYRVGVRQEGRRRVLGGSPAYGVARLSPDRSTIFDVSVWPTPAVVYDAETGLRRPIDAPWRHFSLGGWTDEDTFFGVAEEIDRGSDNVLRARQVVTCEVRTLACTPVSAVMATSTDKGPPKFLQEDSPLLF